MTIDSNLEHTTSLSSVAIRLAGSNTAIRRVKAVNWGQRAPGEGFVISIALPPGNSPIRNALIEECIVTQPANVPMNGINSGITIAPDALNVGHVIRGCLVYGVTVGTGPGQPNNFNAISAWGLIENNLIYDINGGNAIYADSWDYGDFIIRNNVMRRVYHGILFNMVNRKITGVKIIGNDIDATDSGVGIEWYCGELSVYPGAYVKGLLIKDNIINCAGSLGKALSLNGAYVEGLAINNVLQGSPDGYNFFCNTANLPGLHVRGFLNLDKTGKTVLISYTPVPVP